jgi:hypothetical protein
MISLDEALQKTPDGGAEFWKDCADVFSSGAGARVLKRLMQLVPVNHFPIADSALAAHSRGRAEVVFAIWRRSQHSTLPEDFPKPTN